MEYLDRHFWEYLINSVVDVYILSVTLKKGRNDREFSKTKQNKTKQIKTKQNKKNIKITCHLILKVENNLSCRFGCKRKKVGAAQTMSAINVIFDVTKIKQVKSGLLKS